MPGMRRRKTDTPRRYHDRLDRPYKLDKGEVRGAYGAITKNREAETIDPIRRTYTLADGLVFDAALVALVGDLVKRKQGQAIFRTPKATGKNRRMSAEDAAELLTAIVQSEGGNSGEQARALVDETVARLLQQSEVVAISTRSITGRELADVARRDVVRRMRRFRSP